MTDRSIMMLKQIAFGSIVLLAAACGGKRPDTANISPDQLYAEAEAKFINRKWTDAIAGFERFTLQFPTHPRVAEARFRLAEAYFNKKEYITAATEFNRLASDYPAGPWADDARFKVCESYFKLSPKPQLDQQYTRAALDHCRSMETYYPSSEFVAKSAALTNELVNKLAEKEFRAGEFYYKRGAPDSAILYFESTVRDYPASLSAPIALLRLFQVYTTLGYKEEADAAKARLLKDYPDSAAARQVGSPAKTS
jgi:outer membrane protein assembly factor BamD